MHCIMTHNNFLLCAESRTSVGLFQSLLSMRLGKFSSSKEKELSFCCLPNLFYYLVQRRAMKVIAPSLLPSLAIRRHVYGLCYLYKLQCIPGPALLTNMVPTWYLPQQELTLHPGRAGNASPSVATLSNSQLLCQPPVQSSSAAPSHTLSWRAGTHCLPQSSPNAQLSRNCRHSRPTITSARPIGYGPLKSTSTENNRLSLLLSFSVSLSLSLTLPLLGSSSCSFSLSLSISPSWCVDQLLNPRPLGRGRLTYLIGTHATLLCVVKVRLSTFVYLPFYVAGQCFVVKIKK